MASKAAHKRLTKEFVSMQREPPPFVWATPEETNILNWHFLIRGPPDSPFAGGEYHGVLLFPSEYPFKPPGIKMFTPSGRFHPDKKICFSMSDFHPGTWNPAWSVATILTGLLSFMLSDEMTTGSVTSSDGHKRTFAARSHAWNLSQNRFRDAFPDYCTHTMRDLPNMGTPQAGSSGSDDSPKPQSSSVASDSLLQPGAVVPSHTCASSSPSAASVQPNTGVTSAQTPSDNQVQASATPQTQAAASAAAACSWGRVFSWDKWRWGALIILAVMVSRFSS